MKKIYTIVEKSAASFQILRRIDKRCIYHRSNAQDKRETKVYEGPACMAAGHVDPHPQSTDVDVTCVIRIKGKRKYRAQLTEVHNMYVCAR